MKGAVKNAINCKLISRIKGAPRRSLVAHPSTISFLFFFFFSWIRTKRSRVGSLSAVKTAAARFSLVGPSIFSVFFKLRFLSQRTAGLPPRQNALTNVLGHFSERWKDQDLLFYSWNWKGVISSYETKFTHLYFSFGFNGIGNNLKSAPRELISNLESLSISNFLYETKKRGRNVSYFYILQCRNTQIFPRIENWLYGTRLYLINSLYFTLEKSACNKMYGGLCD